MKKLFFVSALMLIGEFYVAAMERFVLQSTTELGTPPKTLHPGEHVVFEEEGCQSIADPRPPQQKRSVDLSYEQKVAELTSLFFDLWDNDYIYDDKYTKLSYYSLDELHAFLLPFMRAGKAHSVLKIYGYTDSSPVFRQWAIDYLFHQTAALGSDFDVQRLLNYCNYQSLGSEPSAAYRDLLLKRASKLIGIQIPSGFVSAENAEILDDMSSRDDFCLSEYVKNYKHERDAAKLEEIEVEAS
jgi:hypothetical protein